jgi:hypothetical protein
MLSPHPPDLLIILLIGLAALLLPHVVGFVSYLLAKSFDDSLAHIIGVMIPPLVSFFFFMWLFPPQASVSFGKRYILLLFGAFAQLLFSTLIHLVVHNRHKHQERKLS